MLFIVNKNVYEHAEMHEIPYSTHSGEGISWSLHTNNTVIMFIIVLKYHISQDIVLPVILFLPVFIFNYLLVMLLIDNKAVKKYQGITVRGFHGQLVGVGG